MAPTNFLPHLLLLLIFSPLSSFYHPVTANASRLTMAATQSSTIKQYLDPQNKVRVLHGLPPLQWSAKLTQFATWYGNQRRKDCALIHSTGDFGENLFWGRGKNWKPSDAVAAWAAEEPYYDYKNNRCVGKADCLHYTQMVWKTTKEVGCAKLICESGDSYIICNYYPHGNTMGQRPY